MVSAQELIKNFSELKTLPFVVIRVSQLAASNASTMHDFEDVIKLDPVLVTRLLKLVNSSYFGLPNKIESISKAVVFAGMKNLRNLVAIESLRGLFKDCGDNSFSRENLWLHSATVAILADMIAKRIFSIESEDIFLAGIIHDIGLIVEDQLTGEGLRKVCDAYKNSDAPLVTCEKSILGTDHCQVGELLASSWHLDDVVLEAIASHHDTSRLYPVSSVVSILQLAEYLAGRMNYMAINGRIEPLAPHLVQHVKNMKADYKIIIRDLPGEMAKAKELYRPEGPVRHV